MAALTRTVELQVPASAPPGGHPLGFTIIRARPGDEHTGGSCVAARARARDRGILLTLIAGT